MARCQLGQPGGLRHDEIAQLACEGALSVVEIVARQRLLCRRMFHRQPFSRPAGRVQRHRGTRKLTGKKVLMLLL